MKHFFWKNMCTLDVTELIGQLISLNYHLIHMTFELD